MIIMAIVPNGWGEESSMTLLLHIFFSSYNVAELKARLDSAGGEWMKLLKLAQKIDYHRWR
jgi:hypothetical protein